MAKGRNSARPGICWRWALGMAFCCLAAIARGQATAPQDVSQQVAYQSANEHSTLNPATRILASSADITITNVSQTPVYAPLHAVFDLSAAGVQMPGALGGPSADPYRRYYFDLSSRLNGGTLRAGESVTFHADFSRAASVQFTYQIRTFATLAHVNLPPAADAGPEQTARLDQGTTTTPVALDGSGSSDPDGTIVLYHWTGADADPDDVQKPQVALGAGDHLFTLVVVDDAGTSSSAAQTTVHILAPEQIPAPMIGVSPDSRTIHAGESAQFDVTGSRSDGDPVTLGAAPFLRNATFGGHNGPAATGTFQFHSGLDQAGVYQVRFTARGGDGQTASKSVQITVLKTDRPPELTAPASVQVDEGQLLTLTVQASDPDGDPLTVSATGLPANALFFSATRTLSFAPNFTQSGNYAIDFQASDGELASAIKTVLVTVNDVPLTTDGGGTAALTLIVNPPQSPTLVPSQRITGAVNGVAGPTPVGATMALINGLDPAGGEQGKTLDVELRGSSTGPFATHFADGQSVANFGAGIAVNSLDVTSSTRAVAHLSIAADAVLGVRAPTISTGDETAVSIVAFNVVPGTAAIHGVLVDPDTGAPLAGAIVTLQGTGYTTTTDAFGNFTLGGLPPGHYTLIVNAPNHDLITLDVEAGAGATTDVGSLKSETTVFNPTAPASVSLLSVLGRGAGQIPDKPDLAKLHKLITDAILLTGGDEAGVLDEYGNQANAAVTGPGLASLNQTGVDLLAKKMARGETISLQEILYGVSFGLNWNPGPAPKLDEWLASLQTLVDQAWTDTRNPENALPLLIFNKGNNLLPNPPTLTPEMRLTPIQAYLFVVSLLSYAQLSDSGQANVPQQNGIVLAMGDDLGLTANDGAFGLRGMSYMLAQAPQAGGGAATPAPKPFTRFWRNFFTSKDSVIQLQIANAQVEFFTSMLGIAGAESSASIIGGLTAGILAGTMGDALNAAVLNAQAAQYVPEPPKILSATPLVQDDGTTIVQIVFVRSPSDSGAGSNLHFVYDLFRVQGDQVPQLVNRGDFSTSATLAFSDPNPAKGTSFYSMTVTRYTGLDVTPTHSWWPVALTGSQSVFELGKSRLTSDYSAPVSVYVGIINFAATLDGLVADKDPAKDAVYYSDAGKGLFYKIDQTGLGTRRVFSASGFKASSRDGRTIFQEGLAVDAQSNLYSENPSSDDQFGGRIFKFFQPDGARQLTGTINYYSQLLAFAHPTMSGPMVIRPNADPVKQDLFIVDNLEGSIKAVAANAQYDANRRVGQPWAVLPPGGEGRVIDMDFDKDGLLYVMDGFRVLKFNDAGTSDTLDALFTAQ